MLRFKQYLTEAKSKYAGLFKKISEEDSEFLQYLIHSKSHVMDSSRRNLNMESVLNLVIKDNTQLLISIILQNTGVVTTQDKKMYIFTYSLEDNLITNNT